MTQLLTWHLWWSLAFAELSSRAAATHAVLLEQAWRMDAEHELLRLLTLAQAFHPSARGHAATSADGSGGSGGGGGGGCGSGSGGGSAGGGSGGGGGSPSRGGRHALIADGLFEQGQRANEQGDIHAAETAFAAAFALQPRPALLLSVANMLLKRQWPHTCVGSERNPRRPDSTRLDSTRLDSTRPDPTRPMPRPSLLHRNRT